VNTRGLIKHFKYYSHPLEYEEAEPVIWFNTELL